MTNIVGSLLGDRLLGSSAADVLNGDAGNDTLLGGNGNDLLFGGTDNDRLSGGLGNDLLDGGDGNDVLMADAGDDQLFGGVGNDRLTGGIGADIFLFNRANGLDRITDYVQGVDHLEFHGISGREIVWTTTTGGVTLSYGGLAAQAVDHGEIFIAGITKLGFSDFIFN